ncbi:MAG: alpha-L-fucosidase, partial [Bacteroidales bacterium]
MKKSLYQKSFIKNLILTAVFLLLLIFDSCTSEPRDFFSTETPEEKNERMQWWRDGRFGMFIHWGAYSIPAGYYQGEEVQGLAEWIMDGAGIPVEEYEQIAAELNPQHFDPANWVSLAKQAGMKYLTITSKHHDGFCLWDSKVTEYDIVDHSPYGRDVLKMVKEECEKQGIEFCLYYSTMDWHHPQAKGEEFPLYLENYMKPQLKELIENYHPSMLWFDGQWIEEWTEEMGRDLYNYLRNLDPDIIINDRIGKRETDEDSPGDYQTPEQLIMTDILDDDWETCMTMNDNWGFKKGDDNWKSTDMLLQNLVDIVSKGGNYLLNIGPDADGVVPVISVTRLQEIGRWMDINGEIVYDGKPFQFFSEGEKIRYIQSRNEDYLYLASFDWPEEYLHFKYVVPEENSTIHLIGYEKALEWEAGDWGVKVKIPEELQGDPSKRPSDHIWVFKMKANPAETVKNPLISIKGQSADKHVFQNSTLITMTTETTNADIFYTTDGSVPDRNSKRYEAPFTMNNNALIRAVAIREGKVDSDITDFHLIRIDELDKYEQGVSYHYFERDNMK